MGGAQGGLQYSPLYTSVVLSPTSTPLHTISVGGKGHLYTLQLFFKGLKSAVDRVDDATLLPACSCILPCPAKGAESGCVLSYAPVQSQKVAKLGLKTAAFCVM